MNNYYLVVLLISLTLCVADCAADEYSFTFEKAYSTNPEQESFEVWEGLRTTGQKILTIAGEKSDASTTKTYNICLKNTEYTLVLIDSYGNGWGSSSVASILTLLYEGNDIFWATIPYVSSTAYTESIVYFHPGFIPMNGEWKYTDIPQTTSSWTSPSYIDDQWSEARMSQFPSFTAITRYYRYRLVYPNDNKIVVMRLSMKTEIGFVLYVNGAEKYRNKLPFNTVINPTMSADLPEETEATFKIIRIPTKGYTVGSTIIISIETHQYESSTNNQDLFYVDAAYERYNEGTCSRNVLIHGSESCSKNPYSSSYACSKAFDQISNTYYYTASSTVDLIYTLSQNNAAFINKYSVRNGGTATYGDPSSWILYGSKDNGQTWIYLDAQQQITYNSRYEIKDFDLLSNRNSYHTFKLSITGSSYSSKVSISGFEVYTCNSQLLPAGIKYPKSTYSIHLDSIPFNIIPISTGFANYTIEPSLPDSLSFDSFYGSISGLPTATMNNEYTISATDTLSGLIVSTTLRLVVEACDLSVFQPIRIIKRTGTYSEQESFFIYDSNNNTLYEGKNFKNSQTYTINMCAPRDTLRFELYDSNNNGWGNAAYITVELKDNDDYYMYSRFTLFLKSHETYKVHLGYAIAPHTQTWKYTQGIIPSNWYTSSYNEQEFTVYNPTTQPTSTSPIWLFRNTFSISSIQGYHTVEFRLKYKSGVILYINDEEFYRFNLPEGPFSTTMVPSGGENSITYLTIVAPITLFKTTTVNTIAIGLINIEPPETIDFDCSVILRTDTDYASRTYDVSGTCNLSSYTNIKNLFDLYAVNSWAPRTTPDVPVIVTMSFNDNRAETINKYCITTSTTQRKYDPNDWAIYGSKDGDLFTLLANETNVQYTDNYDRKCFYIPNQNTAYRYYRLIITEPWEVSYDYYYYIGQWELLYTDLRQMNIPSFYMTPSYIEAIAGSEFPSIIESDDVYRDYTISPALPNGLELDTTTGNIRGVYTKSMNQTYTLYAKNHLGETCSTTIQIAVTTCDSPNILLSLLFHTTQTGEEMSFGLYSQSTTLAYRSKLLKNTDLWFHFCKPAGIMTLYIYDSAGNGWDGGYYAAYIDNDYLIKKGTLKSTESYASNYLYLGYLIKPYDHIYEYSNQNSEVNYNWYDPLSDTSRWNTARVGAFPPSTSITQYYRTTVNIDASVFDSFTAIDISIQLKCGAILYVNGKEIRRINMPTGEINMNTLASSSLELLSFVSTVVSGQFGQFGSGVNSIGIEYHKCSMNDNEDKFNMYLNFVDGTKNCVSEGNYVVIGDTSYDNSYYPIKNLFDDNYNTQHMSGPRCVGATYGVEFTNMKQEYVNSYSINTYYECNPRHPSGWRIEGSNDGVTWILLDEQTNVIYSYKPSMDTYTFFNDKSYNKYRFVATACDNVMIDSGEYSYCDIHPSWYDYGYYGFALADLVFKSSKLSDICSREDGFTGALEGSYGYKSCDRYYSGQLKRKCVNGKFTDIVNECIAAPPTGIIYPQRLYKLNQNEKINKITPVVYAVEYTCSILPELPAGLYFNRTDASIEGTPKEISDIKTYYILCENKSGSTQQDIFIQVTGINTSLYIVYGVLGVFIILIFIVLLWCLINRTKSKKNAHYKLNERKKNDGTTIKSTTVTSSSTTTKKEGSEKQSRV